MTVKKKKPSSPRTRGSSSTATAAKAKPRASAKGKPTPAPARRPAHAARAPLLIELLSEELPPKSLRRLSEAFGTELTRRLTEAGFIDANTPYRNFATPRRLAVLIDSVRAQQQDRAVERRGPAVKSALDANGAPTPALLGFAKSCGVEVGALQRKGDTKGEYFIFLGQQKGEPLKNQLAALVEASLKQLPAAKLMHWADGDAQFVRPVHRLIMLHGDKLVPGTVLGLASGNKTLGHRFLSAGVVTIKTATQYEATLRKQGRVIVDFAARRQAIKDQLQKLERPAPGVRVDMERADALSEMFPQAAAPAVAARAAAYGGGAALLDEVTALTESPAVYVGSFDAAFLDVPLECLAISMKQHQKYFPLFSRGAELLARFAIVSNIETKDPRFIVAGNEKVLRARLSDAKFFYEQDKKTKLADRVPRLANVVYQAKLGTQLERTQRIASLAEGIAKRLSDASSVHRHAKAAALLCKADLLTDMVGEFPELQGVMGRYYALNDGESAEVAHAIEQHYRPRFARDALPEGAPATALALADKLETLVGIYGIGLIPTGDKDPFGLRRAALGVARILLTQSLSLSALLDDASKTFRNGLIAGDTAAKLRTFVVERLRSYLREQGFKPDEIDAAVTDDSEFFDRTLARLQALQAFRRLPEAEALAAANKRIRNILRQAGDAQRAAVAEARLETPAEKTLFSEVRRLQGEIAPLLARADYAKVLTTLARLRAPVDRFFDEVMVMVDDAALRDNRLSLLDELSRLFLQVADISKLQPTGDKP